MNANEQIPISLPVGQTLTITLTGVATALLTEMTSGGIPLTPLAITTTPYVVGPFASPKLYRLLAVNGAVTYSVGQLDYSPSAPRILARSGAVLTAPADTTEDVLATITVPGGSMGPNGQLSIWSLWSMTNNVNVKTLRIRLGGLAGTIYTALAAASQAQIAGLTIIKNLGAQNSQVGQDSASTGLGVSTAALVTSNIDMSQDQTLVLTAQKATAGDTIQLQRYVVEIVPGFN